MLLKAWHYLTAIVLSPVPKVIFLIKATVNHLCTTHPVIKLGFSDLQFLLVSLVQAVELGWTETRELPRAICAEFWEQKDDWLCC